MADFWSTFLLPKAGGNVLALLTLAIWQSWLAWSCYHNKQISIAFFMAYCAGANLAKII